MEKTTDGIPQSVKDGAIGAAAALVLALFTPAGVLLGIEAAVVAGVYFYRRKRESDANAPIDVPTTDGNKEE